MDSLYKINNSLSEQSKLDLLIYHVIILKSSNNKKSNKLNNKLDNKSKLNNKSKYINNK